MANREGKEQKKGKRRSGPLTKEEKEEKMKLIPPFVMLAAGLVTSILMVVIGCGLNAFLAGLLFILFIFYVLGCVLKGILEMIDRQNAPPEPEEEVIEKGAEESAQEGAEAEGAEAETAEEQA